MSKKIYNNLNLLGDLKSSIADKAFISRQPASLISKKPITSGSDKASSLGKSLKNSIHEKLSFYKTTEKKKGEMDHSFAPVPVQQINNTKNEDTTYINTNNKIDIKISVNYPNQPSSKHQTGGTQGSRQSSSGKNIHTSAPDYNNYTQHSFVPTNTSTHLQTHNSSVSKVHKDPPHYNYPDREAMMRNYKTGMDATEKLIRKKILSEGKDEGKNIRNQSTDIGYNPNSLNISLLAYEQSKAKYEKNYNNVSTIDGINRNNYVSSKASNSYIKGQTLNNSKNLNNTSFGYNPLSTEYGQEKSQNNFITSKESKKVLDNSSYLETYQNTTPNYTSDVIAVEKDLYQRKKVSDLEEKIEKLVSKAANKHDNDNDKLAALGKKFNSIRKYFEDANLLMNKDSQVYSLLLKGYNDVIQNLVSINTNLAKKADDYDHVSIKYNSLLKKFNEYSKLVDTKNEEVRKLKQRVYDLEKNASETNSVYKSMNSLVTDPEVQKEVTISVKSSAKEKVIKKECSEVIVNSKKLDHKDMLERERLHTVVDEPPQSSMRNNKNDMINRNVLDDLDALYFRDKVHMRNKSSVPTINCVPKLNFFPLNGDSKQPVKKKESSNDALKKIEYKVTADKYKTEVEKKQVPKASSNIFTKNATQNPKKLILNDNVLDKSIITKPFNPSTKNIENNPNLKMEIYQSLKTEY